MSITVFKTWATNELLTAADLNASFAQIVNAGIALVSPLTTTLDFDGNGLILDADGDAILGESTDDIISFKLSATDLFSFNMTPASSVNGIRFLSAATGNPPRITAQGSDANISLVLEPKVAGQLIIQAASGSQLFAFNTGVASAVNGLTFTPSATGADVATIPAGSDTNISWDLQTKGSGVLKYNGNSLVDLISGDWQLNDLCNPEFRKWEPFGTSATSDNSGNNDDVYFCNRWIILSDGNDIVDLTRETTTVPDNSNTALTATIVTANKKFGILQILEAAESEKYESQTCSLQFKARRTGTSLANVRAMVLEWAGTADSVTSDVVSAWNGAGTNPTLVADWQYSDTPASLPNLSTTYQTYTINGITVGGGNQNVAVFIWLDDVTTTAADALHIGDIQLTRTARAPTYHSPQVAVDDLRCARFYEKTFSPDVMPSNASGGDSMGVLSWAGTTANVPVYVWKFRAQKRATPTLTMFNFRNAGTDGQWDNGGASLADARATDVNAFGARIDNTSTVATASSLWFIHAVANAEL